MGNTLSLANLWPTRRATITALVLALSAGGLALAFTVRAHAQDSLQIAQYRDPAAPIYEPRRRFQDRDDYEPPSARRNPFALPTAPVAAPTSRAPRSNSSSSTSSASSGDGSSDGKGEEQEPVGVTAIPAYSEELLRLSQILGSMHYLRPLCGAKEEQVWRNQMDALLKAESAAGNWKLQLVHSFNEGFRSFERSYRQCTPAATLVVQRYMAEGEKIAQTIKTRYAD